MSFVLSEEDQRMVEVEMEIFFVRMRKELGLPPTAKVTNQHLIDVFGQDFKIAGVESRVITGSIEINSDLTYVFGDGSEYTHVPAPNYFHGHVIGMRFPEFPRPTNEVGGLSTMRYDYMSGVTRMLTANVLKVKIMKMILALDAIPSLEILTAPKVTALGYMRGMWKDVNRLLGYDIPYEFYLTLPQWVKLPGAPYIESEGLT